MFTDIIGVLFLQPRKYMRYYFALIMHAFLVCKYLPEMRGFYHPKWGIFIPQNGVFYPPKWWVFIPYSGNCLELPVLGGFMAPLLDSPFWGVFVPQNGDILITLIRVLTLLLRFRAIVRALKVIKVNNNIKSFSS